MSTSNDSSMDKLNTWRCDIQEDIDEIDWSEVCLMAQKQRINTQFKLLTISG